MKPERKINVIFEMSRSCNGEISLNMCAPAFLYAGNSRMAANACMPMKKKS